MTDVHDPFRRAIEALTNTPFGQKPDAHALEVKFNEMRGIVIDGKCLVRIDNGKEEPSWMVIKVPYGK